MCTLPVDNESVQRALDGKSGIMTVRGYDGETVLSAYGPLELGVFRWAVIAEIDEQEAQAPVRAFGRTVIVVATGMSLLVTLLALFSSYLLTRPLRLLTEGARRLGAGDTDVRVSLQSHDEFGELGQVFNQMSESIKKQRETLASLARDNQELLLNFLPTAAVAQWQNGDERRAESLPTSPCCLPRSSAWTSLARRWARPRSCRSSVTSSRHSTRRRKGSESRR